MPVKRVPLGDLQIGDCFTFTEAGSYQIVVYNDHTLFVSQDAFGRRNEFNDLRHEVLRLPQELFLRAELARQRQHLTRSVLQEKLYLEFTNPGLGEPHEATV